MRRAAVLARDADADVVMRCGVLRMMLASLARTVTRASALLPGLFHDAVGLENARSALTLSAHAIMANPKFLPSLTIYSSVLIVFAGDDNSVW